MGNGQKRSLCYLHGMGNGHKRPLYCLQVMKVGSACIFVQSDQGFRCPQI